MNASQTKNILLWSNFHCYLHTTFEANQSLQFIICTKYISTSLTASLWLNNNNVFEFHYDKFMTLDKIQIQMASQSHYTWI